jgi:rhodanese-related sulfurtransferase
MLKSLFRGPGGRSDEPDSNAPGSAGHADVTPAEARARAQTGALLLDVREPAEWRTGHAPGAIHLPLGQLGARLAELPPDREIIAVCRSGSRSGIAAAQLRRAGFTQVRNMAGGMNAWARAGLPVER